MNVFPVTHSVLSQHALAADILPCYFGASEVDCRLLVRGMNDTYLVKADGTSYILRAYRHGHRSNSDILHELELLKYLHASGVRVAVPLSRQDSSADVTEIMAPEGNRYIAVFTYAPGQFHPLTIEVARRYGHEVAKLHQAMGTFENSHQRYRIDVQHLLHNRVPWILPLLEHRPQDQAFIDRLHHFLRQAIDNMAPHLKWGPCHGDLNGGNGHFDAEGNLTFFDFDCEGLGWIAYDVAVFNWSVRDMPDADAALRIWQAYLDSYQQVQPLSEMDAASIPFFVAARQLWLVGLHCQHADEWTYGNLSDAYFDRRLKLLYRLAEEQCWYV